MRIENGSVWIEVAETYGPRISGFGFRGEPSVFGAGATAKRETPFGLWRAYGGHRLWAAPERFPETYRIDDDAPAIEARGDRGCVVRRGSDALGLASEIALELDPRTANVAVTHTLENCGSAATRVAPWGLTVMAPGGYGVVPREPAKTHAEALVPSGTLALWAYARYDDVRVSWERDAVTVRCDPARRTPWKIGASGERGWCAYVSGAAAFVKRFEPYPDAVYPDRGCALEAFTDGEFFELETLAPLQVLEPGARARHVERWSLVPILGVRDAVEQIVEWIAAQ